MANLEHVDIPLGEIHTAHNWEYANATALAGANISDATQIRKLAMQIDTGELWTLMSINPTVWAPSGGPGGQQGGGTALAIANQGTQITAGATSLNFSGNGVVATVVAGGAILITIPGVSGVSKADVGLGNVDNTSDANKPVSTLQAAALVNKEPTIASGVSGQYLSFDKTYKNIQPSEVGLGNVNNTSDAAKPVSTLQAAAIAAREPAITAGAAGTYLRGIDKTFQAIPASDVGLGNVNNTSDAAKPVSTLQQAAITAAIATAEAYTDAAVVGVWDDRGQYNASTNTFPTTGGRGAGGLPVKGDLWEISVGGTLGGTVVSPLQTIRALVDSPGQTSANWATSIAGTAPIDNSITSGVTTRAPSQDAVFQALATKEPTITAGTTSQYLRGDKSLGTFLTSVMASVLTGVSFADATVLTAGDNVLQALGKLAAGLAAFVAQKAASNGLASMNLFKINLPNNANTFTSTLANTNTAARAYTLPDRAGQLALANLAQNSQSANYTTTLADANTMIFHPGSDTTARTFTIDSNANVPYAIGDSLVFCADNAAGLITIAINTDTLRLAGAGTSGSRSLAANGIATAIKVTATSWLISGTNLS